MKILVTGHRGLLGSACVRYYHGHEVLTIEGDLTDESMVRYWFDKNRPEWVIHAAAKVGGVKANRDQPVDFLITNLKMQNIVIQAAAEFGVKKLVFIGTSCMYPRYAPMPVSESSFMTGPLEPSVESYAVAKMAGYALCRAYRAQYGLSMVTVCPCNLYGLNDNYGPSAHCIPALLKRMLDASYKNEPSIKIWGDGSQTREFMSADDAAYAISVILDRYDDPDLINIGTGQGTKLWQLAYILRDVTGYQGAIEWDTSQPQGIPSKTFDITKISSLGWSPRINLRDGLSDTLRDYLSHPTRRLK